MPIKVHINLILTWNPYMIESFLTAFIVYFVVIDPIGTAPIFVAVTGHQDRSGKVRTAIEATIVATLIMLFFAICGSWVLHYLKIGEPAFKIAGGLILFLVAWEMLNSKRQTRKKIETTNQSLEKGLFKASTANHQDKDQESVAIFPLAIPLLAGPAAVTSVMVISADFNSSFTMILTGYAALLAVMLATGAILALTGLAENMIDARLSNVFSRVTAIILAGLSVQFIVDGLMVLGVIKAPIL